MVTESKDAAASNNHSEDSSTSSSTQGKSPSLPPISDSHHSLFVSQLLLAVLYKAPTTVHNMHDLGVCKHGGTESPRSRLLWYFAIFIPWFSNVRFFRVGAETHSMHHCTTENSLGTLGIMFLKTSLNFHNSIIPNPRIVRLDSSLNLLSFPLFPKSATIDSTKSEILDMFLDHQSLHLVA